MTVGDGVAVGVLSGLVGLTELLTRYRADPKQLTRSLAALGYIILNAAAGLGALSLIQAMGWPLEARPQVHVGSCRWW